MYWLKKLLIWILIAAPFVYTYKTRPTYEQHLREIYAEAVSAEDAERADLMDFPQWEKTHFRDFYLATTVSDTEQLNMISYGFLGKVRIADDTWALKAFDLVPPKD